LGTPFGFIIRDDILEGPQSGNHISALRALWSSVSMTLLMSWKARCGRIKKSFMWTSSVPYWHFRV